MKKRWLIGILVAVFLAASAVRANANGWSIYCSTLTPGSDQWYLFFCELAPPPTP